MLKMPLGMTLGHTVLLCLAERRGIENQLAVEHPEDSNSGFGVCSWGHIGGLGSRILPTLPLQQHGNADCSCFPLVTDGLGQLWTALLMARTTARCAITRTLASITVVRVIVH